MNVEITFSAPFAISTDPVTGHKTEFHSLNELIQGCIDERNFKVKTESYIHPEYTDYNCEECYAIPHVNPHNFSEVVGYTISGTIKKYDTDQSPYQLIDSKKVYFVIGEKGVFASNINKAYIPYVLGTDDIGLFLKIARSSEGVVFNEDIDSAYQIINSGMPETTFRAMAGFNEPKQNQDLFVKLDESFKSLQAKQIKQFFLEKINALKQAISPEKFIQISTNQWGKLTPLVHAESSANAVYPVDALPPLAKEAVIAISEHVQAPIAMTSQCVIATMSHIAQAKVNAPHPFSPQGEPCSLFLLTEGQSGSRKSTSRNLADQAIIKHERKHYEAYRCELEQWKSAQAGLPKKEREAYCAENPPPNDPSTLYSDITLESIAGLYIDGILNNASIASDEAGQFFGGHSMKADTRNQALGGYAKLFDEGFVERTRSKSNMNGSGRAYDTRLSFNLQGQHEVLADALKDPLLRGQGFLPRFILTIPENLAGTRLQDAVYRNKNVSTDHRLIAYWTRCEYLLDDCPQIKPEYELHNGRYVLSMDDAAREIDAAFYNIFEELQAKGQRYEFLQAFASRASQLARRLATVFAYFEGLQCIDAKILKGACEVIKYSLNEWSMYADIEIKAESEAERLIKWLIGKCVQQKTDRLTYSYMQTSCPRPMQKNKNLLEMIIQQLEDSNYLKVEMLNKKRLVVLNPLLLGESD
ncbi:DUF3987 domain-containing protein [Acinetobacter sp. ANC 3813]|uniref:DUF3987 domain-containing protein n=1 Tax=Acinetobacter sp. ANC 3813 TaxID=1977873 RepID=UPI001D173BE9|nr:DUF3987 domain-containing protein [Acinetobacter sp. ANC 3813]